MLLHSRASGVLLPVFSLPSAYGIGDFGNGALSFADFLKNVGQRMWQILPLNPISRASSYSPYSSFSCFAGNNWLISPDGLLRDGFLNKEDAADVPAFPQDAVDYDAVAEYKTKLFEKAFARFKKKRKKNEFSGFCAAHAQWLNDFALFAAVRKHFQYAAWGEWPVGLRDRQPDAIQKAEKQFCDDIEKEKFLQFAFHKQWFSLKKYCSEKNIKIFGDMPIYVGLDSADVWAHPELFKLDENKKPQFVSGVPPDYFSQTGQRWGNPVYQWDAHRAQNFSWWVKRIQHQFMLFDLVRVDHFRGFEAYWEVPAHEETAVNGAWVPGPGAALFEAFQSECASLPIVAEDLGVITDGVRGLMNRFEFPGMRVLLFAFGGDMHNNPHAPHNHNENCVVYTGTHDNNTARGWFENEASWEEKQRLFHCAGREVHHDDANEALIELAMKSPANLCIIPLQDILGLDGSARMNKPSTALGNWKWRARREMLSPNVSEHLLLFTQRVNRMTS